MPWSYPDDIPSSMQHFKPEIQGKAISIANAILKSGGSESVAIATGIKKAKQMSKSGLLKVAGILSNEMPESFKNKIVNLIKKYPYTTGGIAIGATLSGLESENPISGKKYNKTKRIANTIGGGLGLGSIGLSADILLKMRTLGSNEFEKEKIVEKIVENKPGYFAGKLKPLSNSKYKKRGFEVTSNGLIKQAFESGAHSNLPNAWKTMGKGVGQGQRQDIPLAKGLPKVKQLNFRVGVEL